MAEDFVTREQLNDVLKFSQALYLADIGGAYSPWMSNDILKSLNNNSKVPTFDDIKRALAEYKTSESNLQDYSQFMSHWDMIFQRTVMSYVNVLAFDMMIVPGDSMSREDYASDEYKKDKEKVYNFLENFDWKRSFRDILYQTFLNGVFFVNFRKTKWGTKGVKAAVQILPQDRCMITGAWDKGLLFDFDMNFFLQPGVDIDNYDPSFKKIYNRVFGPEAKYVNYIPSNPLNDRKGTYAYWTQLSPDDGFWAFKFDTSNFNSSPYLSPYLKDAFLNEELMELQRDKDIISAYGILAGEIKTFDSDKSQKANQFVIDPVTLGGFMAKVKKGLENRIKAAAVPLENIKFFQFNDNNTDMYTNQLSTSSGVGSGVSRVIYSSDRMSNAEVEAGITDQYNTMKPMYYQFENFMNFFIGKLRTKYKFKIVFDGCSYKFEREARMDRLTKMADKGLVLGSSAWAAAAGYDPIVFERMLEQGAYSDFKDKFSLMLNVNIGNQGSNESVGRPKKDDNDLSESGEWNRNE